MILESGMQDGQKQIHLKNDGAIEYKIKVPNIHSNGTKKYMVQVLVATVHSNIGSPLLLNVSNAKESSYKIHIPNTGGIWKWTEPAEIQLTSTGPFNILNFYREGFSCHGLSIRQYYFKLIPNL